MENINQQLLIYREAVCKIKNAVLQSRYQTAKSANTEMLNLYFSVGRYIASNTRSGKWGTGVIEAISKQLQGELPGLHGFSPSNMKNMRAFFEQWSSELEPNRQSLTAELNSRNELEPNRQSLTADLNSIGRINNVCSGAWESN
ncbi:MAG: DUF1016 N-terminal domain-containing protein [Oscillospiraceae bacterium]|nr:DUF1016 N-terminal domain-containing protein [Oscillospiraceae bacterium]